MIELRRFQGAGRACFAWLPPQAAQGPVAAGYCNGGDSLEERLEEILEGLVPQMGTGLPPFALIGVAPTSWEQEFSPWPAPALGKKSPAFTGGCDAYLADLTGPILAQAEAQFPLSPRREDRMLAGYSLGGLASLYALYQTGVFGGVASLSGSLWFPGWVKFAQSHRPLAPDTRVYLSLGQGEEKSRHPLMRQVGDCTRCTAEILTHQLSRPPQLEFHPGGHFTQVARRWQQGLYALMAAE